MGRRTFPGSQGGRMLRCAFLLPVIHPLTPCRLRGFARRSPSSADACSPPRQPAARRRRASALAWAGGTFAPSPYPAYPTCLTPAGQLRSSSPGLCLQGQFPLNRLNPRLLHSHKLFGLAHQVSETPPERLCCLGLAPGWFKRCHRCSLPSAAACQRGSPAPGRTLGRTSACRREG